MRIGEHADTLREAASLPTERRRNLRRRSDLSDKKAMVIRLEPSSINAVFADDVVVFSGDDRYFDCADHRETRCRPGGNTGRREGELIAGALAQDRADEAETPGGSHATSATAWVSSLARRERRTGRALSSRGTRCGRSTVAPGCRAHDLRGYLE
ncbi:hypothetical protein [Nocardia rhamnosiphila]